MAYRVQLLRVPGVQQHLPADEHRWRSASRWWSTPAGCWCSSGTLIDRRLVSVRAEPGHLSVPAHQHRLVLEPVPAGAGGQRAGLRADRRRAEGGPDRRSEPVERVAGRITFEHVEFSYDGDESSRLETARTSDDATAASLVTRHSSLQSLRAAGLLARHPRRPDAGGGRAYRRGQIEPGEADHALLRVPGRAIADRRARHPHARPGAVPPPDRAGAAGAVPVRRQVADNIRYGRPDASEQDVADGRASSATASWVDDLPQGLQTDVGERGARLSLGQRQLVALARVLLQDPSIVMLDEATASIDPFTEAQIQDGLDVVLRDAHQHRDRPPALDGAPRRSDHRAARRRRSSSRARTQRCWRRAATTPSSTTPTSATNRSNISSRLARTAKNSVALGR